MIRDEKISIIIPVYNSEMYLYQCVSSITMQSYRNIEIIIIDDGSTDNTFEFCKKMKRNDSRIKIFHTENKGVSSARNLGISHSTGQWIMFVDSDDFIKEDSLSSIMEVIKNSSGEMICCNSFYEKDGMLSAIETKKDAKYQYCGDEIKELMYELYSGNNNGNHGAYFRATWSKLFLRETIKKNNIKFQNNIKIGEDALFILDYLSNIKKVIFSDLFLYCYRINALSTLHSYIYNYEKKQIDEYEAIIQRFKRYGLKSEETFVRFWQNAETNYIRNEIKSRNHIINVIIKTNKWFSTNAYIKEYAKMNLPSDNVKTKFRSIMIYNKLYFIVSLIDVIKIKVIEK